MNNIFSSLSFDENGYRQKLEQKEYGKEEVGRNVGRAEEESVIDEESLLAASAEKTKKGKKDKNAAVQKGGKKDAVKPTKGKKK